MPCKATGRLLLAGAISALGATSASATNLQDLVRIKGHERNMLVGMGIVVGLNGTGDSSKDSLIAARPYARLLANLGYAVPSVDELAESDSFALVQVTMEVPATGVREGDRLDVSVETLFNATSLAGGRLVFSPLRLPGPDDPEARVYAYAEGPLAQSGNNPRSAIVRRGGQMQLDVRNHPVRNGVITLVLDDQYAGFPVATMIANAINDEFVLEGFADIAVVEDAKNVRVLVPEADRARPGSFIAILMTIPIDPSLIQTAARIVINEEEGIILVTGNVEIGPVGITHKGITISSLTPPVRGAANGQGGVSTRTWAGIDTSDRSSGSSTQLVELLRAFDQLSLPPRDQIAIIYELKKSGVLHAEIVQ